MRLDGRCRLWGYESYSLPLMAVIASLQFHLRGVVLKCHGVSFQYHGYLWTALAWATQEASYLVNIKVFSTLLQSYVFRYITEGGTIYCPLVLRALTFTSFPGASLPCTDLRAAHLLGGGIHAKDLFRAKAVVSSCSSIFQP